MRMRAAASDAEAVVGGESEGSGSGEGERDDGSLHGAIIADPRLSAHSPGPRPSPEIGKRVRKRLVVSAAGTTHRTSSEELVHLIRSLGKTPVQRDTLYREVAVF